MKNQRRKHNAGFKAQVALEALREQKTINELSSEYGIHSNQITKWKRQMIEGAARVFGEKQAGGKELEARESALYEQIGKLQVQVDWLKRKTGMEY